MRFENTWEMRTHLSPDPTGLLEVPVLPFAQVHRQIDVFAGNFAKKSL